MSETINGIDLVSRLNIPIFSPLEVDDRLRHDFHFSDTIAGFTTTGLYHFLRGLSSRNHVIKAHDYRGYDPYINCALAPEIYEEIFGRVPRDQSPIRETIVENRAYGTDWSALELLIELRKQYKTKYGQAFGRDHDIEILEEGISNCKNIAMIAKDLFFSDMPAQRLVMGVRERKGVQILFSTDDFVPFVKANKYEDCDDYAITIYGDIPCNLIYGIIPLGNYERDAMTGK